MLLLFQRFAMELTKRQQDILDGKEGDVKAKVMKTLIMYGETFGAPKMVDVTGKYGHLVTSFGLSVMKPVYPVLLRAAFPEISYRIYSLRSCTQSRQITIGS